MGHKPFFVIADYLTRNGIAVLRCDDRGTAASQGTHATATNEDFATDTEAMVNYLRSRKEINAKKIGIIGHSAGGIIAFIVAKKGPIHCICRFIGRSRCERRQSDAEAGRANL